MNAEAREDLRQMLLEQLDVERSEYDEIGRAHV